MPSLTIRAHANTTSPRPPPPVSRLPHLPPPPTMKTPFLLLALSVLAASGERLRGGTSDVPEGEPEMPPASGCVPTEASWATAEACANCSDPTKQWSPCGGTNVCTDPTQECGSSALCKGSGCQPPSGALADGVLENVEVA